MMSSRTIQVAIVALVLPLVAAACGSAPRGGGSARSSTTVTASPPAATTASPTATSTAVPANWKTVNLKNTVQLQVPPAWKVTAGSVPSSYVITVIDKDGSAPGGAGLGLDPNIGGTGNMKADVDAIAKLKATLLPRQGKVTNVKRLPDVRVNGVLLYHFQYQDPQKWLDDFGGVTADGTQQITVSWVFNRDLIDRKSAEAFEAQVMPTYRLL